jgi:signal transduction histidine kinase
MTERLARALETEKRFVADASHQLRTPLTGLRLRLEEARAARSPAEAEPDLDQGMREVDRLAGMLEELLVLSRSQNGRGEGSVLDPARVADAAVQRWQTMAADHGVRLVRGQDREPRSGFGAPEDAERCLDALIENAVVYAGKGAVQVSVNAGEVVVDDEGPGLAPGEEEEVFERFHRGSAGSDGAPGTGLGLAIARQLARRWGGDVTLINRPGGGARAVLSLGVREETRS